MRESHVCPKCRHNRILMVAVPDTQDDDGSFRGAAAAIAYVPQPFGGMALDKVGTMISCICRRCGYTEHYTLGIENINVDGRYVQELLGPDPEPFR